MVHIPLPSPKGTNKARLFYPYAGGRDIGATMATSAPRGVKKPIAKLAMDAALDDPAASRARAWTEFFLSLAEYLSADQINQAQEIIQNLIRGPEGLAQDEPLPFPGQPHTGGTMIPLGLGDMAVHERVFQQYPGLARIRNLG
jgi:hypothetical protein